MSTPRPAGAGRPPRGSRKVAKPHVLESAKVPLAPAADLAFGSASGPGSTVAAVAQEEEFAALDAMLQARQRAGLTQQQVAQRMGVKQSALARVESSLGSRKHAPSLATLRKYANAVGCRLEIKMVRQ